MQDSFYPKQVMEYLYTLPNSGKIPDEEIDNKSVFMSTIGSIESGVVIKLFIELNSEQKTIKKIRYLVYGDGYIIAALAKLSEDLQGQKISKAKSYSLSKISNELEIPQGKQSKLKLVKTCLDQILNKL